MPSAGIKPAIPANHEAQTYALACAATRIMWIIIIIIIIIIINMKDWTLWSILSPELQLLAPTLLRSSNCSPSVWSYIFIWVRKLDSNSFAKMMNWSSRNEVTETSGRLHPLWPQNKWLHTPRTTDYRHTRQDRWMQLELAFTLAKKATKPNPFEIMWIIPHETYYTCILAFCPR